MSFVLIVLLTLGPDSNGGSNSMATSTDFPTREACVAAGKAIEQAAEQHRARSAFRNKTVTVLCLPKLVDGAAP